MLGSRLAHVLFHPNIIFRNECLFRVDHRQVIRASLLGPFRPLRTGAHVRGSRSRQPQQQCYLSAQSSSASTIIQRLTGRISRSSRTTGGLPASVHRGKSAAGTVVKPFRYHHAASRLHPAWIRWNGPRVLACDPYYPLQAAVDANTIDAHIKTCSNFNKTRQAWRETRLKMKERIEEIGLKENILTVPNGLCLTRIILTPLLGYLVMVHGYTEALVVFCCAGMTDLLDGYIARNFSNQQSMLGSFLDPMADKFLIATLFVTLTVTDLIPVPLTALIIARDACLMGAGFYIRYKSLPPPRTLSRYFDVSFATAKLSPTPISKVNTAVQLLLVGGTLSAAVFECANHPVLQAFWYVTASTTVLSGLSYLVSKNTYKILRNETKPKKHS